MSHNTLLVFEVTILVLAIFLGFEVISSEKSRASSPSGARCWSRAAMLRA